MTYSLGSDGIYHDGRLCSWPFLVQRLNEMEGENERLRAHRLPCREAEVAQARYEKAEGEIVGLCDALRLQVIWCRYRADDHYDTCEDNCTKAYRYQEQCPAWLALMQAEQGGQP